MCSAELWRCKGFPDSSRLSAPRDRLNRDTAGDSHGQLREGRPGQRGWGSGLQGRLRVGAAMAAAAGTRASLGEACPVWVSFQERCAWFREAGLLRRVRETAEPGPRGRV